MHRTLLATFMLVAAACGGAGTALPTAKPSPAATPVPVEHPLTGVLFAGPQDWQSRPVLAVKVENSAPGRPQAGLDRADIVYEELAEGGITRFIAFFNSKPAARIGPVRSARTVDPMILAPYSPLFGYSGGVPSVISAVRGTPGVTDVGFDARPGAYKRDPARRSPHNLFTTTEALWGGRTGAPPPPVFSFLKPGSDPAAGGGPGSSASFTFYQERTSYEYDPASRTYKRSQGAGPHTMDDGTQIAPVNVLIQKVAVRQGSISDVNGQYTPDPVVTGEGELVLLRDGRAFPGRWVRASAGEPTRYLDAAGNALQLARGPTWIELLPDGRAISIS